MKKKQLADLIMIVIILAIAAAGIFTVGHIQGWFDSNNGECALLTEIRGIVNIQREGISYPAENETVLRAGDLLFCDPGATAVVMIGDGYLAIGEKAALDISDPSVSRFSASITNGEVFANTTDTLTLTFDGKNIAFTNTVASLSVRSGAQSISVFQGTVNEAQAGQMLDWVGETLSVQELSITSLNDFAIEQIRKANETKVLCFTNAELDKLKADRQAAQATVKTEPTQPPETAAPTETAPPLPETAPAVTEPVQIEPPQTDQPPTSAPVTEPPVTAPPTTEPPATEPPVTEPPQTEPPGTEPPATEYTMYCTISIRCDTILNNWDNLDPAKAGYVPSDGWILYAELGFSEGETVFEVLQRACSDYGIQLEYSWTPMYGSYYVEGINNIYEFDCGYSSGWMYQVNGWFPNYGCSEYALSDGDNIVFSYTCEGYGADVGA